MQTFSNATFLRAVGQPADLLPPGPPEIAFAGRSNVGKSSAINALLGRHRLARFSKTPGRTQTINFYETGEGQRLVDLPGYGYARVPKLLREQWGKLVGAYLQDRAALAAVVVVMDARHPLTPLDLQLLGWLKNSRILVLLSKADKLSRAEQAATLKQVSLQLSAEVRLFSSTTRQGVDECRELLGKWLQNESGPPQSLAGATRWNKRPPVKGM
jgi:GTP-binding protein